MSWDGKMYDKYRIAHTDGTPLKGKKYFVLRLDSDDPAEASRVAAAMRAYKNEPRQCDVGTLEERDIRFIEFCRTHYTVDIRNESCKACPFYDKPRCRLLWEQTPYEGREGGAK